MILYKRYSSYEQYVAKQKKKTQDPARIAKWKGEEWQIKMDGFKQVFGRNEPYLGKKAICLGSRTGQEVAVLREINVDAIGVDLVAFPPYTIEGDIHELEFADDEFDFAYTNIFDHSLYPDRFVSAMERVCKGNILLNLQLNTKGDDFSENEVSDPADVVALFKRSNVIKSCSIKDEFDAMNYELVMKRG